MNRWQWVVLSVQELPSIGRQASADSFVLMFLILGVVAKIHVKQSISLIFVEARTVPFYYREMVEESLDMLVKEDVLDVVFFCEWSVPTVLVLKADKKPMQICEDFKEVNTQTHCKLQNTYLHVSVDKPGRQGSDSDHFQNYYLLL